ncbi:MAG: serine hydrolase, partial [Pseudomonadota bacterium]
MADTGEPATEILIDSAARELMQQHGIPGLAIAVTANGTQRFYSYGVTSRETRQPVNRDTLFEIGSISKTFTATLATYAQANGKLSLGESPSLYLPRLRGSALDQVTLVNLATHTAGGFPLQVPEALGNTEQLMEYFSTWQPEYAPGTHRTYANPSIGLLGMVAAKSLGLPFEEALEQQLFPALGLSNSYIEVPTSKLPLYAQGYSKDDAPIRLNPGLLAAEAYGVKTSAQDLIRFVDINLGLVPANPLLQRAIEQGRGESSRGGRHTAVVQFSVAAQARGQSAGGVIQPLLGQGDQVLGPGGQAAG